MQKTFQEVAQLWCERKQSVVKYSSMCTYRLILRTHLLPRFGSMTKIEEGDVQAFIVEKTHSGLSRRTTQDVVALFKSIVKYGARRKWLEGGEWQLDYPSMERGRRLPVLSLRDQRKLMNHLSEAPTPRNIGVLLALCTGMRIGEVCALEWKDVDLPHRILHVRQTAGRIYNCETRATERILSSPKTKHSYREIPLSRPIYEALSAVKKQAVSPFVVGTLAHATDPRNYREYFSRLLRRLQIPPIVFHGLRHTFATRCIESLCDYKTVSILLGHSNVSTTLNLYVHPNLQQKRRCIDRMNKFVG